jgi:hypothetical protein
MSTRPPSTRGYPPTHAATLGTFALVLLSGCLRSVGVYRDPGRDADANASRDADVTESRDADADAGRDAEDGGDAGRDADEDPDDDTDTGTDAAQCDDAGCHCPDGEDCASCPAFVVALTPDVTGTDIEDVDWGHARCVATFGPGWEWYEWHRIGGAAWAEPVRWLDGVASPVARGWVWVSDRTSACFPGRARGVTMARYVSDDACPTGIACTNVGGLLDGPDFDMHAGGCNPYSGDTPCTYARPLVCIRPLP